MSIPAFSASPAWQQHSLLVDVSTRSTAVAAVGICYSQRRWRWDGRCASCRAPRLPRCRAGKLQSGYPLPTTRAAPLPYYFGTMAAAWRRRKTPWRSPRRAALRHAASSRACLLPLPQARWTRDVWAANVTRAATHCAAALSTPTCPFAELVGLWNERSLGDATANDSRRLCGARTLLRQKSLHALLGWTQRGCRATSAGWDIYGSFGTGGSLSYRNRVLCCAPAPLARAWNWHAAALSPSRSRRAPHCGLQPLLPAVRSRTPPWCANAAAALRLRRAR